MYNKEALKRGRCDWSERGLSDRLDALAKGTPTGARGYSECQMQAKKIQQLIYDEQGASKVLDQFSSDDDNVHVEEDIDDL